MDLSKIVLFLYALCISYGSIYSQNVENNLLHLDDTTTPGGTEQFALDIFKRITDAVKAVDYDFMVSPFTIWSLLNLVSEGAQGTTLQQLRTAGRLPSNMVHQREIYSKIERALNVNTTTVSVSAVQAIFSDTHTALKPEFKNLMEDTYKANLMSVNFSDTLISQNFINDFIRKHTGGLIDYLVNADDLIGAKMVLTSAIFFKGQWKYPFNSSLTKPEPFYNENGEKRGNVDMMFQRGVFRYTAIASLDCHVLELPYGKEDRLVMIILLPRSGTTVSSVAEKLSTYGFRKIFTELNKSNQDFDDDEVEVYMPKFTTETDFVLNVILEQMGITDLFNVEAADLSKLSTEPLFISRIFHKTKIEVNEEGTVAAGATGGIFANKATPPRFYINRPFAYLIVEKTTNTLLFCGQVKSPSKL